MSRSPVCWARVEVAPSVSSTSTAQQPRLEGAQVKQLLMDMDEPIHNEQVLTLTTQLGHRVLLRLHCENNDNNNNNNDNSNNSNNNNASQNKIATITQSQLIKTTDPTHTEAIQSHQVNSFTQVKVMPVKRAIKSDNKENEIAWVVGGVGFEQSAWDMLRYIVWCRLLQPPTNGVLLNDCGSSNIVGSVLLHGPSGSGKTAMIEAMVACAGVHAVRPTAQAMFSASSQSFGGAGATQLDRRLRLLVEEAETQAPTMLIFDNAHTLFPSGANKTSTGAGDPYLTLEVLDFLKRVSRTNNRVLVVLVASQLDDVDVNVRSNVDEAIELIGRVSPQRATAIVKRHLGARLDSAVSDEDLVAWSGKCHGFGVSDLIKTADQAVQLSKQQVNGNRPNGNGLAGLSELDTARTKHKPISLSGGASGASQQCWTMVPAHNVRVGFDGIGGLADAKQALLEMVVWPARFPELYAQLKIDPPRGILLHGPPGTGKTMLARAVAKEANANFLSVSITDVIRGYVGESEKVLSNVFKAARRSRPCVLFFDEIQALFGSRDGNSSGNVGRSLVSQLILETDAMPVGIVLMGATNALHAIDPSLLRAGRFARSVLVGLPTAEARLNILESCRKRTQPWADNVDMQDLAIKMDGMTGAEITQVCQRAALRQSVGDGNVPTNDDAVIAVSSQMLNAVLSEIRTLAV